MPILIELPCKPLVKQYIINRCGMPVQFSQNDLVRSLLIRFLQRPDTEYEHKLDIQHYSTSIELPILFREYDRFGNTLTKTAIMNINQTIQDIVEEALYNYIQLHHIIGGQLLKNVIPMFRVNSELSHNRKD